MTSLTRIEGIGHVAAGKLASVGITSIEVLLEKGNNVEGRQLLSKQTGISVRYITAWVNRADMARIKGIGTEYADLLDEAGVRSITDIALSDPGILQNALTEINRKRRLVRRVPAINRITDWVAQARQLPSLIEL
jgi:predicted flap endonuclease-1-like 5' DNA nuclease